VSMQLELARNAMKAGKAEAVGPFLSAAHQIVRHCLVSARESIWDMRSHILERHELVSAVQLVAEQMRGGMTCEIRTRVQGRPRRLPPNVENSLLRIGQEALSNALKHAHPRVIELDFSYQDSVVSMTVADDGPGIDAEKAEETNGRFGLIGMRERVALMNGKLTIGPRTEGGTRVEVIVTAPALS
jgi:signal transduction histidine kinase